MWSFSPTTTGRGDGIATITGNVAVTGSPVSLMTGTGGPALGALSFAHRHGARRRHPERNHHHWSGQHYGAAVRRADWNTQVVTVLVTNTGGSPVIFSATPTFNTLMGPSIYTQTNTCPASGGSLAVGGTCILTVTMTPPTPTPLLPRISYYTFTDNGTGSPQILAVTGR